MNEHETINYVEFPSRDLEKTKQFFETIFGWTYTDYGPDYTAFAKQGIEGGFFKADKASKPQNGAALIVFYSKSLEDTQAKIIKAGGKIVQEIFTFPGGRRFHFEEPAGNEFAVWSDT